MYNLNDYISETKYTGYAVVFVTQNNEVEPYAQGVLGWYQEVFETIEQARVREEELLDEEGGVWEIVECTMEFRR